MFDFFKYLVRFIFLCFDNLHFVKNLKCHLVNKLNEDKVFYIFKDKYNSLLA